MKLPLQLALWLGLCLAGDAMSSEIRLASSSLQTGLLELYTSEGCSSCPPAESWLSGLREAPGLWKDFVPVAFHVDYWDHLGWRDPWSSGQFTARQQEYARAWRTDTIYTPGLVLNGKEWRNWRLQKAPGRGVLSPGILEVRSADASHWVAAFAANVSDHANYQLEGALLACGLASDVKAGENRGRHLVHDFVVLRVMSASLTRKGTAFSGELQLPQAKSGGRMAIAFWVSAGSSPVPVQAVGGWLPEPAAN